MQRMLLLDCLNKCHHHAVDEGQWEKVAQDEADMNSSSDWHAKAWIPVKIKK